MNTTLYLRPPQRSKGKKRQPKSAWDELSHAAFRYRVQLIPALIAFFLAALTTVINPRILWALPAGLMVSAVAVYLWGDKLKANTRDKRIYVAILFVLGAIWSLVATVGSEDHKPSLKWLLILALGTYPLAYPWLRHRRIRASVAVTFHPALSQKVRRKCANRARVAVNNWDQFVRASAAAGSQLLSIYFDPYSVTLSVRLGHARVAEDFTTLRLRRLESAFDARRDSARVEYEDGESSRFAKIRFMLADPHKDPIIPNEEDFTPDHDLTVEIGIFENGTKVIMDLIHTLIAGASGAGKSGVINALMRGLVKKPHVAVVGIDMKPGGLELGKWRDSMFFLAVNGLEAKILLQALVKGIERRGEIMKTRGWRVWVPTEEEPFVVLVVDEVAQLKEHRLFPLLVKLSEISRAYGFAMILATQHPKDQSVPTGAIANCTQRIGLRVNQSTAERLIFDDNATKEGWRLLVPGFKKGTFLIRNERYTKPMRARAYWLDDAMVERTASVFAPYRTAIDRATWEGEITRFGTRTMLDPPDVPDQNGTNHDGTGTDVVDAVLIEENDPADLVLMAIAAGHGTARKIAEVTGVPLSTVEWHIRKLRDEGVITQDGKRKPYYIPESATESE